MVLQLHAALGHVHGREREVALGRDVPVIGQAELEAARRRLRVVRREQPALAPVFEREGDVGRTEDRNVEEAQPRAGRAAFLLDIVELELRGLEPPVLLAGLAGGVGGLGEAVAILAENVQPLGAAARRAVALQEVTRLLEGAGVGQGVVLHARAEEAIDAALQPYAAFGLGGAELAVIAQALAEDPQLVAANLRGADRAHLKVADALDALRVDGGASPLLRAGVLREHWRGDDERGSQRRETIRHGAADRLFR
ncbi:MAG: hypothetical protein K0S03_2249 [Burkholderiales bacterium]|nr:hypothetical protein [Burkholderiales bacterium]